MKLIKIAILACAISASLMAGANSGARIRLDLDPSTSDVDTILTVANDSSLFTVALRIDQIVSIKGFAVRIAVDTSKFVYNSYVLTDGVNTNILGPSPMSFADNLPGSIEIVASSSSPATVSEGYLGTVTFRSRIKKGEQVELSIDYAEITDAANGLDVVSELKNCTYKVDVLSGAVRQMYTFNVAPVIDKSNGLVRISLPEGNNKIRVMDLKGRSVKSFTAPAGICNMVGLVSGSYVVRISGTSYSSNYNLTIP